ncbi:methylenetetrahydrofolate reductase [NAD(P)H] [Stratiformator vulcanicus]|uniref:Methylenetetrahydrofolate reductase n=1 Tax=Stratiformator vulcanicus TaxID=2527980 RepID=A0A517R3Z6_9PLAN|nr:methylenetetrahydrofolate reductase [NAD(P)H] [Stratiformator vulcanicus]QDT38601.1 5,10-methylenetetrahydrofolate reductase [Stratiformator vulcanicus]
MRIAEMYRDGGFGLSIEIFPPKTEVGENNLKRTLQRVRHFEPKFISCTYGAGGTTRGKTLEWCRTIIEECNLPATAHFTCVGSTREELLQWLEEAAEVGVQNIMALRGDAPQGQDKFEAIEGGCAYANELVELIRANHPEFGIGVAGYPEKHLEAPSLDVDLQNLKRKVDAGADAIFTQLFFVNDSFFRFRDQARAVGIDRPMIAGIMPITSFERIKKITAMCGAIFPVDLAKSLESVKDDDEAQFEIGVDHAIKQCRELIEAGIPGIHFYVLNKSQAAERILGALDVAPAIPAGV